VIDVVQNFHAGGIVALHHSTPQLM
jgi:hypothetical protein